MLLLLCLLQQCVYLRSIEVVLCVECNRVEVLPPIYGTAFMLLGHRTKATYFYDSINSSGSSRQ